MGSACLSPLVCAARRPGVEAADDGSSPMERLTSARGRADGRTTARRDHQGSPEQRRDEAAHPDHGSVAAMATLAERRSHLSHRRHRRHAGSLRGIGFFGARPRRWLRHGRSVTPCSIHFRHVPPGPRPGPGGVEPPGTRVPPTWPSTTPKRSTPSGGRRRGGDGGPLRSRVRRLGGGAHRPRREHAPVRLARQRPDGRPNRGRRLTLGRPKLP